VDPRSNAVFRELLICEATRHLERVEYDEAGCLLERIAPFDGNNLSTAERLALKKRSMTNLKILHFQGRFQEAHYFSLSVARNLSELEFREVACAHVCHTADIKSELGNPRGAVNLLTRKILDLVITGRINQPGLVRLKLSLVDAHLLLSSLDAAYKIYSEIKEILRSGDIQSSCSKPGLLRYWIGLARIVQ
jgi:hypothetical protein